jgi:hypothetical protein
MKNKSTFKHDSPFFDQIHSSSSATYMNLRCAAQGFRYGTVRSVFSAHGRFVIATWQKHLQKGILCVI